MPEKVKTRVKYAAVFLFFILLSIVVPAVVAAYTFTADAAPGAGAGAGDSAYSKKESEIPLGTIGLTAILSVIGTLIPVVYAYGKLNQQVMTQKDELEKYKKITDDSKATGDFQAGQYKALSEQGARIEQSIQAFRNDVNHVRETAERQVQTVREESSEMMDRLSSVESTVDFLKDMRGKKG